MRCLIVNVVFKCERPNLLKNFVPVTIGEHIRKKRLESRLTYEELSKKWGISVDRLLGWERGRRVPVELFPIIFSFLGYIPMQIDTMTPPERLMAIRELSRMTQRRLAKKLGLGVETISSFESGKLVPKPSREVIGEYLNLIV